VSTSVMDSLSELSSLLRLVGEEDALLQGRLRHLISSMALMISCFIFDILALVPFILDSPDFILNIK
jgi:hypothetical protein